MLPDDAIISLDSGIHHNWFMQFWEARRPQTMLNTWGYSGMGFGPSAILGAKLAAPDRPCVSICGDGGFTMVPHVLCTAVEYDIPVVWVVWNNFAWAAIRDLQYAYFDGREIGTASITAPTGKPITPISPPGRKRGGRRRHTLSPARRISPAFLRRRSPRTNRR